ncbi:MAG: helix-turn-helix transcriptional regulator [Chloroflexi bacterium]|nr:helix-turn-helix transcriptional regulator [Chloroflexota bacterium]
MAKTTTKRKYDSSRRKARARETQDQILQAARRLFIDRGYLGTTMDSIAQTAGVAPETVYSIFGNKRTILSRIVDVSVVGDSDPIPLLVRSQIREVEFEKNQKRQIEMFAGRIQIIMSNVAPMFEVMRGAAKTEPEVAAMLKKYLDGRMKGMGYFIDCLLANGPLSEWIDKSTAIETTWALTSAEMYTLLTVDKGWSGEEYEHWLSTSLTRLLLP